MPLPKELPDVFSSQVDNRRVFRHRYVLGVRLGAGNFGTAYLVYDKEEGDGQKVMKQICVGTLEPGETVDAVKEARLLSQLKHRNIVQFHESFLDGQFFCIIIEYCDGGDLDVKLREYKESEKAVEESQVVMWLKQLLEALEYMHYRRILHRDLKTKNIFLKDNRMKIGDFGISKILMGTSDKASTFVGTPYYMSPEVLQHEKYDEKCDMWSLGCVLFEMCCLKHAFEGQSLMAVMYKIVTGDIPELPKSYSQALNIVLSRMLARDLDQRQTAKELLLHSIFKGNNAKSSEKSRLTPKERLRLKKQKEADEKFRRHQELAAQNLQENKRRHRESVTRNFHRTSIEEESQDKQSKSPHGSLVKKSKNKNNNNKLSSSLKENQLENDKEDPGTLVAGGDFNFFPNDPLTQKSKTFHPSSRSTQAKKLSSTLPAGGFSDLDAIDQDATLQGTSIDMPVDLESTMELVESLVKDGAIPEDAFLAETLYSLHDDFEVDSSDHDSEGDYDPDLPEDHVHLSDSEYKEMIGLLQEALVLENTTVEDVGGNENDFQFYADDNQEEAPVTSAFANNVMDSQIANMKQRCSEAMGQEVFNEAYKYLRSIWSNHKMPLAPDYTLAMHKLQDIVKDDNNCFLLEQLVYLENEKQGH